MQFKNTIFHIPQVANSPNPRAEYKQLCINVVSQLQNAKQSHALTRCNPVCLEACLYTKVHPYYQPCTAAMHLLASCKSPVCLVASCSKPCSTFHQHASPSTSHLKLANQYTYYFIVARKFSWCSAWSLCNYLKTSCMKGLTLKSVHVQCPVCCWCCLKAWGSSSVGGVLPWKYHAHNECGSRWNMST